MRGMDDFFIDDVDGFFDLDASGSAEIAPQFDDGIVADGGTSDTDAGVFDVGDSVDVVDATPGEPAAPPSIVSESSAAPGFGTGTDDDPWAAAFLDP